MFNANPNVGILDPTEAINRVIFIFKKLNLNFIKNNLCRKNNSNSNSSNNNK